MSISAEEEEVANEQPPLDVTANDTETVKAATVLWMAAKKTQMKRRRLKGGSREKRSRRDPSLTPATSTASMDWVAPIASRPQSRRYHGSHPTTTDVLPDVPLPVTYVPIFEVAYEPAYEPMRPDYGQNRPQWPAPRMRTPSGSSGSAPSRDSSGSRLSAGCGEDKEAIEREKRRARRRKRRRERRIQEDKETNARLGEMEASVVKMREDLLKIQQMIANANLAKARYIEVSARVKIMRDQILRHKADLIKYRKKKAAQSKSCKRH